MKILTTQQSRHVDQATIENHSIASVELMERAANSFADWYMEAFPFKEYEMLSILCGKGNNGGDGLAIARLLHEAGYDVAVFVIHFTEEASADFTANLDRLKALKVDGAALSITDVHHADDLPAFNADECIIDAIVGSGLNRAIEGVLGNIVEYINGCSNLTIAVDMPSGLLADEATTGDICIQADYTFTFEAPKLAFMFPDNFPNVGTFVCGAIGLDARVIGSLETTNYYIDSKMVQRIYRKREKFAHKGVFGHALLIVGSYGKMGAAILATKACLRAGVGLVTVHVPSCGYEIMQSTVPEAMVSLDEDEHIVTRVYDLPKYNTIAVGCGLSTKNRTRNALCYILKHMDRPTVLDADALNILGQSPDWMEYIPKGSILTPHPKEFERMFGRAYNNFERNELQREKAQELGVYIILKGANSCIATPEGECYFNSTGNPGMGTAGCGDVLTGILASLLAQNYTPKEACILGVYIHGLAGDLGAEDISEESLTAGDVVDYLGEAYLKFKK